MNSAPVFDRVYAGLRQTLLSGAFVPGERLDANALADSLGASMTPLRDALYRLSAERIVEARSDGFAVTAMSEPDLRDLYAWNSDLLAMALRRAPARTGSSAVELEGSQPDLPSLSASLFLHIAALSPNREYRHAVALANDRLHAVRHHEIGVLKDVAEELDAVSSAVGRSELPALRRLLAGYHRRRARAVSHIVRALYRREPS